MMGDPRDQVVDKQGPAPREAHCVLWHAQNLPAASELRAALDRRGMVMHSHDQRAEVLATLCTLRGPRVNSEAPSPRALILVLVEPERLMRPDEMREVVERYVPKAAVWLYRAAGNPQLRAVNDQDIQRWRSQRPLPQPRVAASIKSPAVWADAKPTRKVGSPASPAGIGTPGAPPRPLGPPVAPFAPVIVGPRLRLAGELRPGAPAGAAAPVATPGTPPAPKVQESGVSVEPKPPAEAVEPSRAADIRHLLSEEELAMLLAGDVKPSQV